MLPGQRSYLLAQISDGSKRAVMRFENTESSFEIWRRLSIQFALPEQANATC